MKLLNSEKITISVIFIIIIISALGYVYQNPKHYLTSKTYSISQQKSNVDNLEKTLTVIINSPDFNQDIGLDKPVIIAADKTVNVIELKTSSPDIQESKSKFQNLEPKVMTQLRKINSNIELLPAASDSVTLLVEPNYLKIFFVSLFSFTVLSLLSIFSLRYIR